MYLLDTDILSNLVRKAPSSLLLRKLKEVPEDLVVTSAINTGEIFYGAFRSPNRERILTFFAEKVFPHLEILSFDDGSSRAYGELKAGLEKKGLTKSETDLRIAAIALQHRLTLVTGNTRHFDNIPGLKVENWIAD
jgi:predicted nucleic acid-binding protein